MTIVPMCFNSFAQYKEWKNYAGATDCKEYTYCSDCLPEHQKKMKSEGRCEHPNTFFINEEGGWEGVRKGSQNSTSSHPKYEHTS